jgi:hypothetical protein
MVSECGRHCRTWQQQQQRQQQEEGASLLSTVLVLVVQLYAAKQHPQLGCGSSSCCWTAVLCQKQHYHSKA